MGVREDVAATRMTEKDQWRRRAAMGAWSGSSSSEAECERFLLLLEEEGKKRVLRRW